MAKETKSEMIKLTDKVTIIAKKGAKHLIPGKEYEVHPKIAETLIEKGYAEKPKK